MYIHICVWALHVSILHDLKLLYEDITPYHLRIRKRSTVHLQTIRHEKDVSFLGRDISVSLGSKQGPTFLPTNMCTYYDLFHSISALFFLNLCKDPILLSILRFHHETQKSQGKLEVYKACRQCHK